MLPTAKPMPPHTQAYMTYPPRDLATFARAFETYPPRHLATFARGFLRDLSTEAFGYLRSSLHSRLIHRGIWLPSGLRPRLEPYIFLESAQNSKREKNALEAYLAEAFGYLRLGLRPRLEPSLEAYPPRHLATFVRAFTRGFSTEAFGYLRSSLRSRLFHRGIWLLSSGPTALAFTQAFTQVWAIHPSLSLPPGIGNFFRIV